MRPEAEISDILERMQYATGSSSKNSICATLGGGGAILGSIPFSVLGAIPSRKCWNASGVGEIYMLPWSVPSRIELAGATHFYVGYVGAGYLMVRGDGDGVRIFMDALVIQFFKRSRSFKMALSYSWWMVAGASLTVQERKLSA